MFLLISIAHIDERMNQLFSLFTSFFLKRSGLSSKSEAIFLRPSMHKKTSIKLMIEVFLCDYLIECYYSCFITRLVTVPFSVAMFIK
jgi:hypothetical protein